MVGRESTIPCSGGRCLILNRLRGLIQIFHKAAQLSRQLVTILVSMHTKTIIAQHQSVEPSQLYHFTLQGL